MAKVDYKFGPIGDVPPGTEIATAEGTATVRDWVAGGVVVTGLKRDKAELVLLHNGAYYAA